jgi:hypothetical protein
MRYAENEARVRFLKSLLIPLFQRGKLVEGESYGISR